MYSKTLGFKTVPFVIENPLAEIHHDGSSQCMDAKFGFDVGDNAEF
jgi:hypothetical protein